MHNNTERFFFELIQLAIGNRQELSQKLTAEEWNEVFSLCKKQSLVGIGFAGLKNLPAEQRPPKMLIFTWSANADVIPAGNEKLNKRCKEITDAMADAGFGSCVLKGQGNLVNYPEWLKDYRTSGDIDLWAWPKDDRGDKNAVIEYVIGKTPAPKQKMLIDDMRLYHIDYHYYNDTVIEMHFMPNTLNCPWNNKRFQSFCDEHKGMDLEALGGFYAPSLRFNVVYQMVHIYKHLFVEGIGLRQLLDYYMVLNRCVTQSPDYKTNAMNVLSSMGMTRFAGAVMWVLQTVFGMSDKLFLCDANEKAGQFLLDEIMLAGNFGHYDERNLAMKNASKLKRFCMLTSRNWRFLSQYPSEVLWDPYNRAKNVVYRNYRLWKYKKEHKN